MDLTVYLKSWNGGDSIFTSQNIENLKGRERSGFIHSPHTRNLQHASLIYITAAVHNPRGLENLKR